MKWLAPIALAVVLAVMVVLVVGSGLPVEHSATVERAVAGTERQVWDVITDVERFPEWRPGVAEVVRLEDRNGLPAWRESGSAGRLTLSVVWFEPPVRMVVRVTDDDSAFGGAWTYELSPADEPGRTRVTITEDGEVYSPLFRFVSRYVTGHERTLRRYLEALEGRMQAVAG